MFNKARLQRMLPNNKSDGKNKIDGWAVLAANKKYPGAVSVNPSKQLRFHGSRLKISQSDLQQYRDWFWNKLTNNEKCNFQKNHFHMMVATGGRPGAGYYHRNHPCTNMAHGGLRMIYYVNARSGLDVANLNDNGTLREKTLNGPFVKWHDSKCVHRRAKNNNGLSTDVGRTFVSGTFLPKTRPTSNDENRIRRIANALKSKGISTSIQYGIHPNGQVWNEIRADPFYMAFGTLSNSQQEKILNALFQNAFKAP